MEKNRQKICCMARIIAQLSVSAKYVAVVCIHKQRIYALAIRPDGRGGERGQHFLSSQR